MYKNLQTFVDITNGPTDIFSNPTGIFQGDTLAPYFFLAVIDYILHQSVDNISKKGLLLKGLLFWNLRNTSEKSSGFFHEPTYFKYCFSLQEKL